jgi:sugar (pentulose or hexulose) kinase
MMAAPSVPGRVVVTARAHERVMTALAADALGIPVSRARVRVHDDAGALGARVTAAASVGPGTPPLITRIDATRRRLAEEGSRLTGATVSHVSVRITDTITESRRVT